MNPNTKKLLGAVIAAALAIAVYYGVVSQQQANSIQNQANQTLGTTPAAQQGGAPNQQGGSPGAATRTAQPAAPPPPIAPSPPQTQAAPQTQTAPR